MHGIQQRYRLQYPNPHVVEQSSVEIVEHSHHQLVMVTEDEENKQAQY
jgi:hypothetical protein